MKKIYVKDTRYEISEEIVPNILKYKDEGITLILSDEDIEALKLGRILLKNNQLAESNKIYRRFNYINKDKNHIKKKKEGKIRRLLYKILH